MSDRPSKMKRKVSHSTTYDPELLDRLDEVHRKARMPKSVILGIALSDFLDRWDAEGETFLFSEERK